MKELRCPNKLYGHLDPDENSLEIRCRSAFCGHKAGVVILHRFDLRTGDLIDTKHFKETEEGV